MYFSYPQVVMSSAVLAGLGYALFILKRETDGRRRTAAAFAILAAALSLTHWVVALLVLLLFVLAVEAGVRGMWSLPRVHPVEGYFLIMLVASSLLILHISDASEALITVPAVLLAVVMGRVAMIRAREEREKSARVLSVARELKRIDRERADFTAMVAHQLRSPLGGIRSAAVALTDGTYGELPEKAKGMALLVRTAAERLLGLAETYLQGIRLHEGTYKPQMSPVRVHDLVESVFMELAPLSDLKRVPMRVSYDRVPDTLTIDRDAIANCLFNFLDNALKYTENGHIDVRVSWKPNVLSVDVQDTGIGLTSAEARSVFSDHGPRPSPTRRKEGSRLGLHIVKLLIRAAGGSVSAMSPGLGKGSTFHFQVPATR